MRKFDYIQLGELSLSPHVVDTLISIHKYKEKQELYLELYPDALDKLSKTAKVQSTKASNAIEGIITTDGRLKKLMSQTAVPQNFTEEQIVGYRKVLDVIDDNYTAIQISKSEILSLHAALYSYTSVNYKGQFKTCDNAIIEIDRFGNKRVRFQPVNSLQTEVYFEAMIEAFNEALNAGVRPLLLIPAFVHDFLCIHPFEDGNGRMSRLLTLLLLYKCNYLVGKYISIEKIIEDTSVEYYNALHWSSEQWHSGDNDPFPFIRYMLMIVMKAYMDCNERLNHLGKKKLTSPERVLREMQKSLLPLSKNEIMLLCPDLSQKTIERALKELQASSKISLIGSGRASKYRRL